MPHTMHPTRKRPAAPKPENVSPESAKPLFPGREFISTVLHVLESKEKMTGRMAGQYVQRAVMAGLFIGIFISAFFMIQGQASLGGPGTKLAGKVIAGTTFGWALVLIYYTNSELLTSNMMLVSIGAYHHRIDWLHTLRLLVLCFGGNLLGALVVSVIVRFSTVVSGPGLDQMVAAANIKIGYLDSPMGVADLFVRAILCNFCINIAMLMVYNGKLSNDFTKCCIMIVAVFVFTFCGFEHSVADSAVFLILGMRGLINGWKAMLVIVVALLGNFVGGGILIGYNFAVMNDERSVTGKRLNETV